MKIDELENYSDIARDPHTDGEGQFQCYIRNTNTILAIVINRAARVLHFFYRVRYWVFQTLTTITPHTCLVQSFKKLLCFFMEGRK